MSTSMTGHPREPRSVRVSGHVRFADGIPASRTKVAAFDRDLRSEQPLGETESDQDGAYSIEYSEQKFLRQERGTADLVVKALDADGSVLVSSAVLFNAPEEAAIDLTIPLERKVPPTLIERISSAVEPLLGRVTIKDLEEDQEHQDLTFLSGEAGFDRRSLARFALAHRLAHHGIDREFWFALLGSSFFKYAEKESLKRNLAILSSALPGLDTRAVRKAITGSLYRREIPARLRERTEEWIKAFLELVSTRILGDPKVPSFARQALEHAGIKSAEKQAEFARLSSAQRALTPELGAALEKAKSFKRSEIADLRTSYQLADLTRGDFTVVRTLKEKFNIRQPDEIRILARQSQREWVNLIQRSHKAGEINLPLGLSEPAGPVRVPEAELYGKMLERQFREAFPTAAFAGGLARASASGGPKGLRYADALGRIIERQPKFDLLRTPLDDFLSKGLRGDLQSLARDNAFKLELKAVQRVFKLAPTFEATDAMLADGLHSAQMVYRLGESEFVRRYGKRPGFTIESARRAWSRAADTHAAVLTVIGDLAEFQSGILPGVLRSSHPALATFPNWNNLFQEGDICHCEDCRSVLGPAAYFTDLLMFLRDRRTVDPAFTVKDVLFKRRPDLGYLELNCQNALTTLPYVDVVCEVLENVVAAGENDVELAGFAAMPAGPAAEPAVTAALSAANISVGTEFTLSQVNPVDPNRWVVHGDDSTYLLKKKATPNFFAALLPNTKAGGEELRAYPAYVNPKAYKNLKAAKYPLAVPLDLFAEGDPRRAEQRARSFSLPFDLFAEEVRAAFRKCYLQRWDLMRTFRGGTAPNNPTDGEIAAEYFGIACDAAAASDERRLILVADVVNQQAIWGETSNAAWLDLLDGAGNAVKNSLCNVKYFLQKTGLEYNELLTLLDLPFVNPARDMRIQHLDASCDTDRKVIQGLVPAKLDRLDRIHRFLRLWRKLGGWKMWELDRVLRCSGIGHRGAAGEWLLDEKPFLINLYYLGRLRSRLGAKTTVEQLCALCDHLSTESHFTKPHEKRADGFYQSLFLNKKVIQPVDPAFAVAAVDVPGPTAKKISNPDHRPVILSALGLRETDLALLAGLTRASDGAAYISDDLTLANLSFLWRHAWLARLLKFKTEEWKPVLKLLQEDVESFADPKAAFEFVENVDHLRATGFTPDELNWLLAADRSAKAAVKEADAARFLMALRTDLQALRREYDPARYDFLEPPADLDRLTALLMSLLQRLNRNEVEAQFFIDTLRDGITQEKEVPGLPAGFAFPAGITGAPHNIRIRYEPVLCFSGVMTAAQRTLLLTDPSLVAVAGLLSYKQAIQDLFDRPFQPAAASGLPPGFTFPAAITGAPHNIPIRYEPWLRFTGLMTAPQQATLRTHASLGAVTGIAAYQEAIDAFFQAPRLALKLLDPVFTESLPVLPAVVDFKALPDPTLASKISYDAEERALHFVGILSADEKAKLDALSADVAYRNAVNGLFTQPRVGVFPAEKLWLQDADLTFPLRDLDNPANDNLNANVAVAVTKALAYLSKTLTEGLVIQRAGAQLGLPEGLTRRLSTEYAVLPETLLVHLTGTFVETIGVVDYATLKTTFDAWFWACRTAVLWKKWKLTLDDWKRIRDLTAGAKLYDFAALPLDAAGAMAPSFADRRRRIESFLRTGRLMRFRESLPETAITLLEVLAMLSAGAYAGPAAFASDVERVNEAWTLPNVEAGIAALDLTYPKDYLLAENWERVRRAFYFVESLNADVATVKTFAAPTMTEAHAKSVKGLLHSKFGGETWLALSAEIQDAQRERKRDALVAYLLTKPMPGDAPSRKWENTNDLYAYYLLDVEMDPCQLTSRLVQGSGSVQLFVQRCFMGLEPEVRVQADGPDGDSTWHWWKWMRKYRVWEANRKVFLWPENWIEPELKKDRSSFFREFENELLQNDVNQQAVETAFANYLEKLDGVAQLEIAGFYQEDDGDNALLHVFGRTSGAEPHIYYYRRFDYRQWTPWEKVDLDIQGDYVVPAVVEGRLYLLWPVFTELPDEEGNSTADTPSASTPNVPLRKASKRLRLQLAVSAYRQGKWTPKRVSKDSYDSTEFTGDIIRDQYHFWAIDSSSYDGRFTVQPTGSGNDPNVATGTRSKGSLDGCFELVGCKGGPVKSSWLDDNNRWIQPLLVPDRGGANTIGGAQFLKWIEASPRLDASNDFQLENWSLFLLSAFKVPIVPPVFFPLLVETPGIFRASTAWHLSYMDSLWLDVGRRQKSGGPIYAGSWLPMFYADKGRTFAVLPSISVLQTRYYYPAIAQGFRDVVAHADELFQNFVNDYDLSALTADLRHQLEVVLQESFPAEEAVPPYSDALLRKALKRLLMQTLKKYVGLASLVLLQSQEFEFRNFYHPFVCDFAKLVHNPLKGIPALMSRETQLKKSEFSFRATYRPTVWVVQDVALAFSLLDIVDLAAFASRLAPAVDPVSAYVSTRLSPNTLLSLAGYQATGADPALLQIRLISDLNDIIWNETVFDPARFGGVTLRLETQELLAQAPRGEDLIRLNRLLLEDAYPVEIRKNQGSQPKETVDFSPDGAYSPYNWELFFHAPLLVANALSRNQRFEEARNWYQFIFNPLGVESGMTGGSPFSKYWITKPFFETTTTQYVHQRIENALRMLAGDSLVPGCTLEAKKALEGQVFDWRTNPFEPHRIANYRTVAYQKTVVMKYLDNLIAWADYLFRQDSMESINEATQLYVLAAELLGPRPKRIPPQAKPPLESFNELEKQLDAFANAMVEVENLIPPLPGSEVYGPESAPLPMLYFCIPHNEKMLGYWDTVADRLYKIRHCMNIEGVVRQVGLFEPPIEPGALVKAVAAGVDIVAALADLDAPLPVYRFNVLLQKANEVCNDVKALGAALLSALEKKDGEALGLLRQGQEIRVLEAVKAVRERQIDEAKENLAGVRKSKELAEIRKKYYESREFMNAGEVAALSLSTASTAIEAGVALAYVLSGGLRAVPEFLIGASGFGGSPHATAETGGKTFGSIAEDAALTLTSISRALDKGASIASAVASYKRRQDDWDLQKDLAVKEIAQVEKSIAAAELRVAIAERELENHVTQTENAKAIDAFMRSKYTNEELYLWFVGQVSGVFFQSYKLAYDLAKRAERCLRFELGLQDSSFVSFGYWDSLKKGLLSGEKLQYDLRRLESAYLDQNRRDFELTKAISLVQLNPLALVQLRETGRCFFRLPEEIFDLDYPGHYFRRVKSVSLSLPCVAGPYTTISCTLRLLKNSIRVNTASGDSGYPRNTDDAGLPADDSRFLENNVPVKAIAISSGQDDSGVFELSFRDDRYLPFEGAGVISDWSLELFSDLPANNPDPANPDFGRALRQFDYRSITDAILRIKYTAREDTGPFKNAAVTHLRAYFAEDEGAPSLVALDLRREFGTQWSRFISPTDPALGNVFDLPISPELFRIRDAGKRLKVNSICLLARCTDPGNYTATLTPPLPAPPPAGANAMTLVKSNAYGGLHFSEKDVAAAGLELAPTDPPVNWSIRMTRPGGGNLTEDPATHKMEVEDLLLVLGYQWE